MGSVCSLTWFIHLRGPAQSFPIAARWAPQVGRCTAYRPQGRSILISPHKISTLYKIFQRDISLVGFGTLSTSRILSSFKLARKRNSCRPLLSAQGNSSSRPPQAVPDQQMAPAGTQDWLSLGSPYNHPDVLSGLMVLLKSTAVALLHIPYKPLV